MSTISFAKVPGAGSSAPVEAPPVAQANAEVVAPLAGAVAAPAAPAADSSPAVRAPSSLTPSGFYSGEDDETPADRGDVRLPRLNIIQGLSGPELKKIGPDGTLVLKKSIALPQPLRIVVAGMSRKRYAEKMPKFGVGEPRIFDTLEEVVNAGGTDMWKQSRENVDEKTGARASNKAWFQPMVTSLLLIEKPTKEAFATVATSGKPGPLTDADYAALEEHFPLISEDGKAFSPCVYTVKSTSFGGFFVPLKTEQTTGVLRHGYFTRFVGLTTRQARAFEPVVSVLEPTSEAVRKIAKTMLS